MQTLIVAAPPSPTSLTARLLAAAEDELVSTGHDVDVIDLAAIDWDPVVRPGDYGLSAITGPVGTHAAQAIAAGTLDPTIARHQELLRGAELIVFMFPLWWFGMPAILKGWVDRVYTQGFAFGLDDAAGRTRKYGDGGLAGKRGLVITSAGDRETSFARRGVNGGIDELLFPITHGIFFYTGTAPLEPLTVLGVDTPVWAGADDAEAKVRKRLAGVTDEAPIPYRRMLADYDGDRVLRPELAPGREDLAVHRADR
ncbi:NAD(P)H dehydrogenase (quinone) [Naumannella cuiyingiana]|uniref:NAD(P)H dehydrogenase (Quinone) n=1 Tax=Naumannella cuiyingiana TaxID=1347891 RepID=A0A7Z0DC13_9ACTN|nr:NAD(P)H-dependent oxidoreductase [Naumannella cuiyingiana]NYI72534.1 NAD(P)H dehydrogenase (quinone) [Naumannella cuiyingiana]